MTDAPRKPFWKRKRWIAAAVLWLAIPMLYELSIGPAVYCHLRGWLTYDTYVAIWAKPIGTVTPSFIWKGFLRPPWEWWFHLGEKHAAESL